MAKFQTAATDSVRRRSSVDKQTLSQWNEEAKKKKPNDALDMDIDSLFQTEPTWRGSRRKNLFAQRMKEAEEESVLRRGKGLQDIWEASRVGNFERVMDLLFRSKNYKPSEEELSQSVHAAAAHGREDVIDLLIQHGADPSYAGTMQRNTSMHIAAAKGHVHAVLQLVDRGGKINVQNDLGQTPLHLAAQRGHAHVVKALVAEGAEAWHKDTYGKTALDNTMVDTQEHELCREVLEQAVPFPARKSKLPAHEDVDGSTPAHHWLVSSVHGEPRVCAMNGLERPTNFA